MSSIVSKVVTTSSSLLLLFAAPHAWSCGQNAVTLIELPFPAGSTWRANALNAMNQMTGYVIPAATAEAHVFFYDGRVVTDLGTLGGAYSQGFVINASGQIAGESSLSGEDPTDAFLWSGGPLTDLGNLGRFWTWPTAINDSGWVAGFAWTPGVGATIGFICTNGSVRSLGTLGGDQSYACALNQAGVVVGGASLANGDIHGFSFSDGVMSDLGTLGGNYSSASALNNAGVIVGESTLSNGFSHGFAYSGGVMTDVETLGGTYSSCLAINDRREVIGSATTAADETHAFLYVGGAMTDLGTLGGGYSFPVAINNLGQVVGLSLTSNGVMHAFLWQNGSLVDLNSLLPPNSGWELRSGELINDAGRIAGSGFRGGVDQMFILDLAAANHPPVAVAGPDQTVDCRAQVTLDGTSSSDPDGDALTYQWSAAGYVLGTNNILSGWFALGTNAVTLTVTDPCGASAQASVVVRVVDTNPPTLQSVTASPDVLSPPNHKLTPVTIAVAAADNCDPAPVSKILSITANEATDPGDIQLTGDLTASLAASRNPSAGGRIYTITVQATDASGNSSTATVQVTVPQGSQSGDAPAGLSSKKPNVKKL